MYSIKMLCPPLHTTIVWQFDYKRLRFKKQLTFYHLNTRRSTKADEFMLGLTGCLTILGINNFAFRLAT